MTLKNIAVKHSLFNKLLLILAFTMLAQYASASTTYYYFKAKVTAIGSGTVYVSDNENDTPIYGSTRETDTFSQEDNSKKTFYFWAKPSDERYNYIQWHLNSENAEPEETTGERFSYEYTSTNTSDIGTTPNLKVYASFHETWVKVNNPYPKDGSVSIDPILNENEIPVTLTFTKSSSATFLGWKKQGTDVIESTENPYTFTVTEKAVYEPVLEGAVSLPEGYYYIRSKTTGKILNVYDDYLSYRKMIGSGSNLMKEIEINSDGIYVPKDPNNCPQYKSLFTKANNQLKKDMRLMSAEEAKFQPGTVIFITDKDDAYDMKTCGTSITQITKGPCPLSLIGVVHVPGMLVNLAGQDNQFKIFMNLKIPVTSSTMVNFGSIYLAENSSGQFVVVQDPNEANEWEFVPYEQSLASNPEMYYSIKNSDFVNVDGKYYTTLRTDFNYKYDPQVITAYIVTNVDDFLEGRLTKLNSDVIPAGECVILCSNSLENEIKLLPTLDTSSDDFSGNLLHNSITPLTEPKYNSYYDYAAQEPSGNEPYPHKSCYLHPANFSVNDCYRAMIVKDGNLAFDGDPVTAPNGQRAYLQNFGKETTLLQLVNEGVNRSLYNITDLTGVQVFDEKGLIICKDDKNFANKDAMPNPIPENETWIDYMPEVSGLVPASTTYDQSNWIELQMPQGTELTATQMAALINHRLSKVVGRLVDKDNPTFQLDIMPTSGSQADVQLNTFIAASFGGTQVSPVPNNNNTYFFVQPKPMEFAYVNWAYWDGDKFTAPPTVSDGTNAWNLAGLQGEFAFNDELLEEGYTPLEDGTVYNLSQSLIRLNVSSGGSKAPQRDGQSKTYVVSPTSLTFSGSYIDGVITDVMQLGAQREVAGVEYYNLAGMRSTQPWQGINIVVTRYTDGTTSTTKRIKR